MYKKKTIVRIIKFYILNLLFAFILTGCGSSKMGEGKTADADLSEQYSNEEITDKKADEKESYVDIDVAEYVQDATGETAGDEENVSADNPYRKTISMNYDEIKEEESKIRELVNGGECTSVNIESSTEGSVWDRTFWFHGSDLIFAYYKDATDGSPDQRYYFKEGCLIEWIPYTGNGAPENERRFVSDRPLNEDWYDLQERILKEADVDIDFYGDSAEEYVITSLVDKLYNYERMVLTDITWDAGKYKAQLIDFTTNNRELAIAALSSVNIEKTGVTKTTLNDMNIECYLIPEYIVANAEEEIFGRMVSMDELPEYDGDFISSSACRYNGTPAIILSLYEDETAYVRNNEYMTKEADGSYIVIHEAYCGYWGNNTGLSNFQVEYKLRNDGEKYSISHMNIRKIKNE